MGIGLTVGVVLFCLPLMWIGLIYVLPVTNKMFSLLWEDPQERQRRKILKRLKELCVDGTIPEETAVLLASAERQSSEEHLLDVIGALSSSDVRGVLLGKRSALGVLTHELERAVKRGTGPGR